MEDCFIRCYFHKCRYLTEMSNRALMDKSGGKKMKYWLFGAGRYGKMCLEIMGGVYEIRGFIDNKNYGYKVKGYNVYSYKEFLQMFNRKNEKIVISCADRDSIFLQLYEDGLAESVEWIFNGESLFKYENAWDIVSNSQLGEEIGVRHWYECYRPGFRGIYVDVGAYHPFCFSNTRWAYEQGWKGVNIDASDRSIALFNIFRPNDININCGVSDEDGELAYYDYGGATNTFCYEGERYRGKKAVPVKTLNSILEEHHIDKIDFLDIDVEGLDEKVVMSFDWKKYSPKCVLIEILHSGGIESIISDSNIHKKMKEEGYGLVGFYTITAFYLKKD